MARKPPVLRGNMMPMMPEEEDKHEKMLSEMHDALYTLGSKIRKPIQSRGDKLLPSDLRPAESDEAKSARSHIERVHRAMKREK